MLKIERGSAFLGVKTGTMTWEQLTALLGKTGADPASAAGNPASSALALALAGGAAGGAGLPDPATKLYRELFVGNVVEGTSGADLHEFLGAVMTEVGLADFTLGEGNPIMHVRTNGKFAFIELRSMHECDNALNLDGIPFQVSRGRAVAVVQKRYI